LQRYIGTAAAVNLEPAHPIRRAKPRSGNFQPGVRYLVDVLADAGSLTFLAGTAIVPAVLSGSPLRETLAALVTEELAVVAVVPVEIEFELCPEGSLAVPTNVWHTPNFSGCS
jgi:hypothetical protein